MRPWVELVAVTMGVTEAGPSGVLADLIADVLVAAMGPGFIGRDKC
jgi:hypothetical protein